MNFEGICWSTGLLGAFPGPCSVAKCDTPVCLCVKEHCEQTLICDFNVVEYNLMTHRRTPSAPGAQRALLEMSRCFILDLMSVQEHREELLIYDADVVTSNAMSKSNKNEIIRVSEGSFWDLSAPSWGLLSVQEHREETLIYDVEVVKSNAMKNLRTPRGSCDQRALF